MKLLQKPVIDNYWQARNSMCSLLEELKSSRLYIVVLTRPTDRDRLANSLQFLLEWKRRRVLSY
jgi:hypothetical protein